MKTQKWFKAMALSLCMAMLFSLMATAATYTIQKGDVLWKIAKANGTTWQELAEFNNLKNPNLIFAGQKLRISSVDEKPVIGLKSGKFTGEAKGFAGPITMEIELKNNKIVAVNTVSHRDSVGVSDAAFALLPQKIVSGQTILVDVVSGCTFSSKGVLDAVKAAIGKSGLSLSLFEKTVTEAAPDKPLSKVADVVVVGGGGAGLTAAINMKYQGYNVILVEKQGIFGGNTLLSLSYLNVGGSRIQKELGSTFSADDFYKETVAKAGVDPKVARVIADKTAAVVDWLVYDLGAKLGRVMVGSQLGTADGAGPGTQIIPALVKEANKIGVDSRLNTKGTKLIMKNDRVAGVTVEGPNGSYDIQAKTVIITSGGFAGGTTLLKEFVPTWASSPTTNSKATTGDGIVMARAAGAALRGMDVVRLTAMYHSDTANASVGPARTEGGILVNANGKRFMNDIFPDYTAVCLEVQKQPGGIAYIVFDQKIADSVAVIKGYIDAGYCTTGATIEELATNSGIDKTVLAKTLKDYQGYFDNGKDLEFERPRMPHRLDGAPYYAVKVYPGIHHTMGGIQVNERMQIVDTKGNVMPGLYAAGEVANDGLNGSSPVSVSVVFGTIAGESAAADRKAGK